MSSVPRPRWLCVATGSASSARSASAALKAGRQQLAVRVLANHELRARTSGHPLGLDADQPLRPGEIGVRDPNERVGFLGALPAHRRPALEPEVGAHPYVGADRILRDDDLARDPLDDVFDPVRTIAAREHVERRRLEQLGKPRHVDPGFVRPQVGDHRELGVEGALHAAELQPHDVLHARNADAIEREPDVRRFFLTVGEEVHRARLLHDPGGIARRGQHGDRFPEPRVDEVGRDLGERDQVERPRLDVRVRYGKAAEVGDEVVDVKDVDVDRTRA